MNQVTGLGFIPPAQGFHHNAQPAHSSHRLLHLDGVAAMGQAKRQITIGQDSHG
jgi:hypothetical protein